MEITEMLSWLWKISTPKFSSKDSYIICALMKEVTPVKEENVKEKEITLPFSLEERMALSSRMIEGIKFSIPFY